MAEYVSESISKRMTEMADEILTLRARLAEVEAELSEERDHAAEGWERARHLQGLLQAAERGESKQIRRAEAAEAEVEFMRAWCASHYGVMPPTREQNAAFMRALDEMEGDR